MRIVYLTTRFPRLSETFIYREIEALRKLGLNIRIFSNRKPIQSELDSATVSFAKETTYLFPPSIPLFIKAQCYWFFDKPVLYLQLLWRLASKSIGKECIHTLLNYYQGIYLAYLLKNENINHIHVHIEGGAVIVASVSAAILGITYSFTAHGTALLVKPFLMRYKVSNAKFVIAISAYNRAFLIKLCGNQYANKIYVVHCGVDTNLYLHTKEYIRNSNEIRYLAVGRLVWQKAHDIMIEAFSRIKDDSVIASLEIIGDGPLRNSLEKQIKKLDSEKNIHLLGSFPPDGVVNYYGKSDIFVLSSVSEGIPIVLMEAMSSGLPVIAPSITGIPEIIDDKINGILVKASDSNALYEAMIRLLRDDDLRNELGRNARKKVEKEFNIYSNTSKLCQIFTENISDEKH